MDNKTFIASFRKAFGENTQLPIAFWYSDRAIADTAKTGGCFFKHLNDIANGTPVNLTGETIGCGGGKFYCGFTDMPQFVPQFVSQKEHYKETPEMVVDMIYSKRTWINENRNNGHRSFIGFFDPSVRPYVNPNVLSFIVPMSRFRIMLQTMHRSCLFGTHAWNKVRQRIIESGQ